MAGQNTTRVSSFVFLDLEATGLAGIGEKPRVTELSLVAVHRTSLLEPTSRNTPRILNKLTLCLNPQKAIGHEASSITGLYNDALSLQCPFSESVVDICNLFFEQLPLPICLFAHNGHKYDFPLLSAELHRIGRHFPADILCADTLDGFRDVLSLSEVQEKIWRPLSRSTSPAFNIIDMSGRQQMKPRIVRRLQLDPEPQQAHPLSSVTPEMQVVKANINFSNAPKKKPLPAEPPKSVRVSSAKRKLEFGASTSELAKNEVDDVDRQDVLDSIHGFHLTPRNATRTEKLDQNDNMDTDASHADAANDVGKVEEPARLWQKFIQEDEVPDEVLIKAVAQFEQNQVKSSGAGSSSVQPSTLAGPPAATTASWASIVQRPASGNTKHAADKTKGASFSAQSSSPKGPNGSPSPTRNQSEAVTPATNQSDAGSHSPVPTTKPTTPTTNGASVSLDSFPTPSPSPHKEVDEKVLTSTLSPLASPFIPQSMKPNPNQAHLTGSWSGRRSPVGFSLALTSLHKRVLGYEPEDSHRAEDDCMSLLRLSNKLSPWFCEWADRNAVVFKNVAPLYKASKRPKKPSDC